MLHWVGAEVVSMNFVGLPARWKYINVRHGLVRYLTIELLLLVLMAGATS